ncbi:MAG: hypothetical protein JWM77_765 [Rhodospirillales bacterium]|nr:hypothetical protein [Rhodospirillales bacterium]
MLLAGTAFCAMQEPALAQVEEVVVTATRRATRLQDTPVAVSTISGAVLESRGAVNLFDAAPYLPGLTINGTAGYGNFPLGIRGIAASTSLLGSDDPVAVYIDGVYIGKPAAIMAELLDLDRIEIVRGPQGTLYGRNATAGAVLLTRREPGHEPDYSVDASYGSFGRWRVQARASTPIEGDRLRGSIAVSSTDMDGWGTNSVTHAEAVKRKATAAVGTLVSEGDVVKFTLRADGMSETVHDAFQKINAVNFVAASPSLADSRLRHDPDSYALDYPTYFTRRDGGLSLNVEAKLRFATLHSVTGFRHDKIYGTIDTDGTAASLNRNQTEEKHDQYSQSLFLTGTYDRLDWIAGVDLFKSIGDVQQRVSAVAAASSLNIIASADVESVGGFGEATWRVTDQFSATAGARYSHEQKRYSDRADAVGVFPPTAFASQEKSWDAFSPSLRLSYKVTQDALVYASVAKGFKSGGFSAGQRVPFEPETVWTYEAGAKTTWLGGKLRVNGAIFYSDYKNLQVRVSTGLGTIQTLNAGASTVQGAEFESEVELAPGFHLSGFANYVDATYDKYLGIGGLNNAGQTLNRAPKWQVGATARYERRLAQAGRINGELVYSYRSRIYFQAPNLQALSAEPYRTLDANVGYETEDGHWTVAVLGKNITDNRHINNVVIFGANLIASYNEPASVRVQLGYRF